MAKAAPALFKQLNEALAGGEGEDLIKGTKVWVRGLPNGVEIWKKGTGQGRHRRCPLPRALKGWPRMWVRPASLNCGRAGPSTRPPFILPTAHAAIGAIG